MKRLRPLPRVGTFRQSEDSHGCHLSNPFSSFVEDVLDFSATCPYRSSRFVRSGQDVISRRLNESASLDKLQHHDQDISRHITYGLTCLSGRPRNTTPLPCGNTREPTQESIGYVAIDPIVGVETCSLRQENVSGLHQDRLPENNTHLVGIGLALGRRFRVFVPVWILKWILCRHCSSVRNCEGQEPLPA